MANLLSHGLMGSPIQARGRPHIVIGRPAARPSDSEPRGALLATSNHLPSCLSTHERTLCKPDGYLTTPPYTVDRHLCYLHRCERGTVLPPSLAGCILSKDQ